MSVHLFLGPASGYSWCGSLAASAFPVFLRVISSLLEMHPPALAPAFSLDKNASVAVWLRIMRHQMVTHGAEAVFDALADPTRRAVLDLLRSDSLPAGQIARSFPISRPAISKHLRLLRRANLVREHRSGRHRFYRLNPEPLQAVDLWLEHYRVFWNTKLGNLKAFIESGHIAKAGLVRKKAK
jgi:DNA-binding transcriptional ArsR family regulator